MDEENEKSFSVRIGPVLKSAIEKQQEIADKIIKDKTYGICSITFIEAGEIIAKKVLGMA